MKTKPKLTGLACDILSVGHGGKFKLVTVEIQPANCACHPMRFLATIQGPNNLLYRGEGPTPVDAVTGAVIQDRLLGQGKG